MRTIYKYPIDVVDSQELLVAKNAVPIHAGLDPSHNPCIWCEVEPFERPTRELIDVFVVGTGNPIPEAAKRHIGSFVQGCWVWHVYTK